MANHDSFEYNNRTYKVRLPNSKEREEGERIYSRTFSKALTDGCLLDGQIMKMAESHGLWNDERDQEVSELKAELATKEKILDAGGIELDEAEAIALEMRNLRSQLIILNMMLEELKSESAPRKADSARTNYFVARCALNERGVQIFKSLDDFYMQQNGDLAQLATLSFSKVWYNYNEESFTFPEDRFLKEYNLEKEEEVEKVERKPFLKNGKPIISGESVEVAELPSVEPKEKVAV